MIRFTADVSGDVQLDRAFNRVSGFISDFRSVWPAAAQAFYEIETEQFASQGAKGASGKWAPLSPAYAKFKAVEFPGQPILRATSSLFDSLTRPDALDSIYRSEPMQLTMGSKAPYALMHQTGAGRLPARPPISLSENDKRKIQKAIQSELVRFTREAGFQVQERAA